MPSLITMIGRNAASGAFDRDFSSPRHSARRPVDRIGAAEIDPELGSLQWRPSALSSSARVFAGRWRRGHDFRDRARGDRARRLARLDQLCGRGIGRGHDRFRRDQRRGGVAAAVSGRPSGLARCQRCAAGYRSSASSRTWRCRPLAASALAGIGLGAALGGLALAAQLGDATLGVFAVPCRSLSAPSVLPAILRRLAPVAGGTRLAGGARRWVVATGAAARRRSAPIGGSAGVARAAGAAGWQWPCRAIAPVTESSPCSSAVTREYSRSRSPLSVSIAEASRRASFWLSRATGWICCACRADRRRRPARAATRATTGWPSRPRSRRRPRRRPTSRSATARGGRTRLPRPTSRSARRRCLPSSKLPAEMVGIFGQASLALPRGLPNHAANINRKCAAILNPGVYGEANRFDLQGKTIKDGPAHSPRYLTDCKDPNDCSIQPDGRARGRRGHADALVAAEGAASGRRPVAAGACAGCGARTARAPRSRS